VPRPVGLSEKLVQAAAVRLPDIFPLRQIHVATREKLAYGRKRVRNQQFTQKNITKLKWKIRFNDAAGIDIGHRFHCQSLTLLFMFSCG
jgi:hypothetical protein